MNGSDAFKIFAAATKKQLDALDLASEGLTSKQIALELEIAPRTVDQRIDAVRSRLKGIPRNDLMRLYRKWKAVCEETTYDPIPLTPSQSDQPIRAPQTGANLVFEDSLSFDGKADWDQPSDWLRQGIKPSELSFQAKLLMVLGAAIALLMGFSLIIASAEGINSLAAFATRDGG